MSKDEDIGVSVRVVDHNLALLDALAELAKAKAEITENLGNIIKALIMKAGGEVVLESMFISAADDPTCTIDTRIEKDQSVRIWIEKQKGGE